MKNRRRKLLSVERRDIWDSPVIYQFWHLSVDRLKHKLKHVAKKDRKVKSKLEEALERRCG
jgi:arabinogalactan endo-1,4-beta-galactosidase